MTGMNKMVVMIGVMMAARKLDGEDPMIVYYLRVAYGTVQVVLVCLACYIYLQAQKAAKNSALTKVVYIPPPPTPFGVDDGKKKYTEVVLSAHVLTQARNLVGSTLFGVLMTTGLHMWKGMIMGLAMQTVMTPLNMYENVLAKSILLGGGAAAVHPDKKIFGEKDASELTADDEVVDEHGQVVVVRKSGAAAAGSAAGKDKGAASKAGVNLEELLLDTWDAGAEADVAPLVAALNSKNVNFQTSKDKWTALMILSGLAGAKNVPNAIRQLKAMGAKSDIVDVEGWNCMHWAAYHGSAEGAKLLLEDGLTTVKDKEGKTPLHHARAEGNMDVAKLLEEHAKNK